ncbi:ferritin-like domain-containing protein [Actinoplanes sp. NPDC051633]|uniref:ferritin-like domain-containing protein n=1 Tax=Actinoplanes sp. NPDC051633 TaxID=3155670 RepID=UPI003437D8A4
MNEQLSAALSAEEAAIYAYGTIGVHLTGTDRELARSAEADHRARRDQLVAKLDQLKASAPPAPAGYDLPFPVADRAAALKLAVRIEDGVAQAWRAAVRTTAGADRASALSALSASAVQATKWRRRAGIKPLTIAFPGKP